MVLELTPQSGALIGGGLAFAGFVWAALIAKPQPANDALPHPGNVHGAAAVASNLKQIEDDGLMASLDLDGGGFFVGTYTTLEGDQS